MADPANPYAQYASQKSPADVELESAGRSLGELGQDYQQRAHEAGEALWKDLTNPGATPPMIQAGKVGLDIVNDASAPFAAAADWAIGRPIEAGSQALNKATHGATPIVPKETGGDLAMGVLPIAGEAMTEAKIAKAAKEAGVSVETIKAHLNAKAQAAANNADLDASKRAAARRLIVQGKLDSRDIRQKARERQTVGAGQAPLLSHMDAPAQRVVRAAGAKLGDADTVLEEHRRTTRGDIAAKTTQRTEKLSPYEEGVEQRRESLVKKRDSLAATQYRGPYSQPIQTDERLFEVLNSPSSFQAIADARATARERMLDSPESAQQYHELTKLRDYYDKRAGYEREHEAWESGPKGEFEQKPNPKTQSVLDNAQVPEVVKEQIRAAHGWKSDPEPQQPEMPTVSGGALDRIRISMRDKAESLSKAGRRGRAGGVGDRGRAIDEYLDSVPHLKDARATYADYSKRIEQLDFDKDLSTMRPEAFKAHLSDLNPEQRKELVHSVSERLSGTFGKSSRASQSLEDLMTTGNNFRANLRELLGPNGAHVADAYMRAIDLMGQDVDKANFAASRVGSQTAMIQEDAAQTGAKAGLALLSGRHHTVVHEVMRFIDRHFRGLQPNEARQIADWATQQEDIAKTLGQIADAAESKAPAKADGSVPPKIKALLTVGAIGHQSEQIGKDGAPSDAPRTDDVNPYAKYATPEKNTPAPGSETPDTEGSNVPALPAPPPDDSPSQPGESDFDSLMKQYAPGYTPSADNTGPSGGDSVSGLLDKVRTLEGSGDTAVSPKGAVGRYQITPDTANTYNIDISRLKDPEYARQAATKILTKLNERYAGDETAILVAYNAGPGRADRWLQAGKDMSVLPEETRQYLARAGYGDDESPSGDYDALVQQYAGGAAT